MPPLTHAMHDVLHRMARARRPPLQSVPVADARAAYEAGADMLEIARPTGLTATDFTMPMRDGARIAARLYRPATSSATTLPALIYFHGGGFVIGSIATHDILCRRISDLAGCAVVSVDYRLAPEYRFPTAAHDAWDALKWLHANAAAHGLDAARLAVGGDSAGGTLAAVCAIEARNAGLPLALQLLFYPGVSAYQDTPSHRQFANGFVLDAEQIQWFFHHYLHSPADRASWRFAPLLEADVEGVAPAWIGLAECDPLVDEGVQYGDKLREAGVAV